MSDDPILAALGRLEAGLARLEQDQVQLRADLMARMDRLQDTLTAIRDDIGVNMASTTRVREAHDNTREELRSLGAAVDALHRKVRQIESRVRDITGDP